MGDPSDQQVTGRGECPANTRARANQHVIHKDTELVGNVVEHECQMPFLAVEQTMAAYDVTAKPAYKDVQLIGIPTFPNEETLGMGVRAEDRRPSP